MKYLYWLDMEMSGLDHSKERILEVALVVTDLSFHIVKEYMTVVYQDNEVLKGMDTWCVEHHGKSGLTAKVPNGKPEKEVEQELIAIINEFSPQEKVILAGNSIGQDRKFIDQWMPNLAQSLHYRMLDVSSFKIVYENLFNKRYDKKHKHRALEDILESIEELKFYLQFVSV
ncbi:oligoribonuclease [Fluviispira multicolorata]|uniref:Oligoribonuclease n=1 Tax=Fluviispira multicolorata TaxID=2654512 RepID=A0A833JDP5_9BACT|nr:oligoribonuclease [Fluviispira multicolorata]KAB8028596.1 oligoribonuclease [Fluviispira multicolorata]